MRSLSQRTIDLLNQGRMKGAELLRFDFASGTYGFWTGKSEFEYNGLNYLPGGILSISSIPGQWGYNAQGLTIELASSPNDGLTPEVLATMDNEIWHQRPVTIYEAFFDPDSYELLFVEPLYRGLLDTLEFQDGSETKLIATCESRALDNSREGYRMRSMNDQHLINSGDNFYSFAESTGKTVVPWGQNRQA
ncbi:DUF2163 domain-containing protein [Bartonella tamiae]|uniref:DUF2163 domain-containing protein n=1 Tax=Bartonella tamiae Th239 TaxID=1094558 RepID=J0ZSE4_9HYPH|nr:DUF2163 domain-containing protein [Bartonella tamiae]EJF91688.1 hypothetical protein ME5_00067 [Bartonella tamiae Th239]